MPNGHERIFGKATQPHVLILANGDKVRHMTIRPWMIGSTVCIILALVIGYIVSTTYLVFRDDLIGATIARQARMRNDYEDRIAALRAQVDRVTSRQLLDQQVVETKVEKLLERQEALSSRHGRMGALIDRAENSGLIDKSAPTAAEDGDKHADASSAKKALDNLLADDGPAEATPENTTLAYVPAPETVADRADRVFAKVTTSLKMIEQQQHARVEQLIADASNTASQIENIVTRVGVSVPQNTDTEADVGGPYVPPENVDQFDQSLVDLDSALTHLEAMRGLVEKLPFRDPAKGKDITSSFGNRKDPFLGKLAMHEGVDFRFAPGENVKATAPGKIVTAGWNGGYGNMVEIDHGDGISTRYGHMAEVLVHVGETIKAGETIGIAGSTGRSTGTHLHYEVREDGRPIDPLYFVRAGQKLQNLID